MFGIMTESIENPTTQSEFSTTARRATSTTVSPDDCYKDRHNYSCLWRQFAISVSVVIQRQYRQYAPAVDVDGKEFVVTDAPVLALTDKLSQLSERDVF